MKYDGFISYRHTKRQFSIARKLQSELHKFARPWNKIRAVRLYRDETNLSANPDLWKVIKNALSNSNFFILMASPEAAKSLWVKKELDFWLKTKSSTSIILILTSGKIEWDSNKNKFHPSTNSIPAENLSSFNTEPLWIDLTWANQVEKDFKIENMKFRSAISSISATLQNKEKDEIEGEDIRQYRKTQKIKFLAILSITILAAIAGLIAYQFKYQKEETEIQKNDALAKLLTSEGLRRLTSTEGNGRKYLLSSLKVKETPSAISGLLKSIQKNPHLKINGLGTESEPVAAAYRSKNGVAVIAEKSGDIILWKIAKRNEIIPKSSKFHTELSVRLEGHDSRPLSIALSESTEIITTLYRDGNIIQWDLSSMKKVKLDSLPILDLPKKDGATGGFDVSISENGETIVINTWEEKLLWRSLSGLDTLEVGDIHSYPNALNSTGDFLVTGQNNSDYPVLLYDLDDNSLDSLRGGSFRLGMIQSLGISPNQRYVIAGRKDLFNIWDLKNKNENPRFVNLPLSNSGGPYNIPYVTPIVFDESSKYFAAYYQKKWHIYDLETVTLIGNPIESYNSTVAYGGFGPQLLIATDSNEVRILNHSIEHLTYWACRDIVSPIDEDEWNDVVGEQIPRIEICND